MKMKDLNFFLLSKKHPINIIIDNNFLIDAVRHPEKFASIIKSILDCNVQLITIDAVLIEYYKGSNNKEDISRKEAVLNSLNLTVVPTDKNIAQNGLELAVVYQHNGKGVSVTDYYLAGALMKYNKSHACLLSRDHSDFPSSIFKKEAYLVVDYERSVQTFILYSFDEKSYKLRAKRLLGSN